MRDRIRNYMLGRYGIDSLNRFLILLAFLFSVVALFFASSIINILAFLCLAVSYVRMISKNYARRTHENAIFCKYKSKLTHIFKYHIYHCPSCGQKIRIPRGKGKIMITCPKCTTEFQKKS